jgi:hypothetical protein
MQIWDAVNGSYELLGGALCWLNVRRLIKDKEIKGVSWSVQFFFATWGWWNCFYYPALNQWLSFAGGLLLSLGSTSWVIVALHYYGKTKNDN